MLRRYQTEGRELRASEPRDLIERVKDICRLREAPPALDADSLELAWRSFFGLT